MPFNPENLSSLEQQETLKPKTGLEGFYTPEFQKTLKTHPKPFVSILQNDATAYKTIVDIIGEDRAREIQAKQPPSNEKNPEHYSEDPTTAEIQKAIYENLGISVNTDSNGFLKKLIKGCIDGLIIGNVELIQQIREKGLGTFLEQVVSQFKTTEGWKKLFAKIGDDVGNIFSFDAYKTGKTGSEYLGMIGGAGLAGWALKKGGKSIAETGAKVAIKTEGKTVISSSLEATGQGMIKTGEVLQVPYKAVEKATGATIDLAGKGIRAGTEALNKVPGVNKVATAVKSNVARIVVGEGARVVASRETPTSLKYQIGAVGDDVSKIKPFDRGEGKPKMEEPKVGEKPSNERKVIDIPKTLISFEEFEKLPWGGNMHDKEALLKMYDKYKEFISLSPKQQSDRIYQLHPYLNRETVGELAYNDVLGAGNFGIVIKDSSNPQLAFKINKDPAKGILETSIHNRVSALIEAARSPENSILRKQYKADYGADIIGIPPTNVDIPRIRVGDKGQFTMKTIDGESVLTKMFSEKQWFEGYEGVLEAVKRSYPEGYKFTDYELYRAMADIYKFGEGHLKDRIRDPELQQLKKFTASYVGHNAPQIATLDDFLIQNGIHQADLHGGNIIVPNNEPGKVYLIDFGEAVLSK